MSEKTEPKILFSVVQGPDGTLWVDWHRDISLILEEISPDYELTDRLIDLAEEIVAHENSTNP